MGIRRNQRGQISLFFSASLIVLITIIAFVINIGLFVKAKINLQNSVDAAAYAGASVQARQLTKIAYLNWEMRNIYKEWMFKYYVLGNVSLEGVKNPSGSVMDFKMKADLISDAQDPYDWPSICIHLAAGSGQGGTTNICSRYSVPGLPEFGGYSMPGAEEASRAFIDALLDSKMADCNFRTKMNLYVANSWAYNVLNSTPDSQMTSYGPAILADRQGAWPAAVELAMRIRNLEYVVNRPPVTEGICNGGSTELTNCSKQITEFTGDATLGNERITKAFYSAYRNLATTNDELKETFTLRELAPTVADVGTQYSASYLFVPGTMYQQVKKHYLDLKVMSVNYATFYDTFIQSASTTTSGTCDVTKLALPVPGYPLGFYKNPDIVTYYAVKGEAEFVGMFNPFGKTVKLTAYAAAKPFGGRIGPVLFNTEDTKVVSRKTANNYRSAPYIIGINLDQIPDKQNPGQTLATGSYTPGAPLPLSEFWLAEANQPVGYTSTGGVSGDLKFGIPNLVYDFPQQKNSYSSLANPIYQIVAGDQGSVSPIGLYNTDQFKKFQSNIFKPGNQLNSDEMGEAVLRARAPTEYDAFNYLIPSPNDINTTLKIDAFGFIAKDPVPLKAPANGDLIYTHNIYAPLYSSQQKDILYKNPTDVVKVVNDYMAAQKPAIDKYREALNKAAQAVYAMRNSNSSDASDIPYLKAADGISDLGFVAGTADGVDPKTGVPKTCQSMLGQFLAFYLGSSGVLDNSGCPVSLGEQIGTYFAASGPGQKYSSDSYALEFVWKKGSGTLPPEKLFTGFMPGSWTGINDSGSYSPIFGGDSELMRRNSYSTKFVTLNSLGPSGHYNEVANTFPTMSEGKFQKTGGETEIQQKSFANSLSNTGAPSQVNY